ncbi:hypothetical protein H5410_021113 [Solanum commersonii]|uniref:Retrotransposon gag domain-containing protein n=1 Tax=Solanum commersonii TaxID=4109 RepID=A0A9J5ZDB1_SOLCO|nr:hypothetical protein H5410_021113 [Solanum commersonii]
MNTLEFTRMYVIEDPDNFVEELYKVFEFMCITYITYVELASYQLKIFARILFDELKKNREAFLGCIFPRELRELKLRELLNLKKEAISVQEYSLKFTALSWYASEMVADMRNMMTLFVFGLSHLSNKEGKETMLIGDMDLCRLMINVHQVEREKLNGMEKFRNNKAKTTNNEIGLQKIGNGHRSCFQQRSSRPDPSSPSGTTSQGSVAQGFRAHIMLSVVGPIQENVMVSLIVVFNENSPYVVNGMPKFFTFHVNALLDSGANLSFVTPYVAIRFDITPEQLLELFSVSTPICESILVETVYHDCTISVYHKDGIADLEELDMVDFDVILGIGWVHACYSLGNCKNLSSQLSARKLVSKGCIYHFVQVNDSSVETPPIQSILIGLS